MKWIGFSGVSDGSLGMVNREANSFSCWMRVQDQFEAVLDMLLYFEVGLKKNLDLTPDSRVVHGGLSKSYSR